MANPPGLFHGTVEATPQPVTPSVHPDLIEGDSTLALAARRDLGEARGILEKLAAFEADAQNDPTLTPDARAVSIYDARQKSAERAEKVLARAVTSSEAAVTAAEKALADAARPSTRALDQEIRAHVARLPEGQRAAFLQDRARAGDTQATEALLSAPRYLSGLPDALGDDVAQELREMAAGVRAPVEFERLADARRVRGRVVSAWHAARGMAPKHDARIEALKARATKRQTAAAALR